MIVTEKDRMIEWLSRSITDIESLQKDHSLSKDEKLHKLRQNYGVIKVLTMVARGEASMIGIAPISEIKE